jgi:uncharacterized protein with PIN domain
MVFVGRTTIASNRSHRPMRRAELRFYEELNDFLPAEKHKRSFAYTFEGTPSIKDAIEAVGVPHTEIDVILVDGRSVGFEHRLHGGERVAVYPMFEAIDVSPLVRLRPQPLRITRFVADVHLGVLARYLRLVGFDTVWRNDLVRTAIVDTASREGRIILTRDRGTLRHGRVTHGYWLRTTDPLAQLAEVVRALDLATQIRPYTRCLECNGLLAPASAAEVASTVPPHVASTQREFRRCDGCGRVYWRGSHQPALDAVVATARAAAGDRC